MAAGKPGDHPLTDVLVWKRKRFGAPTDGNIQRLAELLSQQELFVWWDAHVDSTGAKAHIQRLVQRKLAWAERRAKESGWEVTGDGNA